MHHRYTEVPSKLGHHGIRSQYSASGRNAVSPIISLVSFRWTYAGRSAEICDLLGNWFRGPPYKNFETLNAAVEKILPVVYIGRISAFSCQLISYTHINSGYTQLFFTSGVGIFFALKDQSRYLGNVILSNKSRSMADRARCQVHRARWHSILFMFHIITGS